MISRGSKWHSLCDCRLMKMDARLVGLYTHYKIRSVCNLEKIV